MELFDKIAVVTQAASEVGKIAAKVLFEAGASVYLTDADEAHGRQVADRLIAENHWLQNCEFARLEASDPRSIEELNSRIAAKWGGVDIVVNIRGWAPENADEDFGEASSGEVEESCFEGFANVARGFLPSMIRNGSGKIINVAGFGGSTDHAHPSVHSQDDDPAIVLTRELAEEAGPYGVNVNCLWAGPANMSLLTVHDRGSTPPSIRDDDRKEIEEIVLFFASPASRHLTGQVLELNTDLATLR